MFSSGTVLLDVFYDGEYFGAKSAFTIAPPPAYVFIYNESGGLVSSAASFNTLTISGGYLVEVLSGGSVSTLQVREEGNAVISGGSVTTLSGHGGHLDIKIRGGNVGSLSCNMTEETPVVVSGGTVTTCRLDNSEDGNPGNTYSQTAGTVGALTVIDLDSASVLGGSVTTLSGVGTNMTLSGGGIVIDNLSFNGGTLFTSGSPHITSCFISSGKAMFSQGLVADEVTLEGGSINMCGATPKISSANVLDGVLEVKQGNIQLLSAIGGTVNVLANNGRCTIGSANVDGGTLNLNASVSAGKNTSIISATRIYTSSGEIYISATNPQGTAWAVTVAELAVDDGEDYNVPSAYIGSATVTYLSATGGEITCRNAGVINGGFLRGKTIEGATEIKPILYGLAGGTIKNIAVYSGGTVNVSSGCVTANITDNGGKFISAGTIIF